MMDHINRMFKQGGIDQFIVPFAKPFKQKSDVSL